MRLVEIRPGVFRMEITVQELSALVAGARRSLTAIESESEPASTEARDALQSVLSQFDAVLRNRREAEGDDQEPPP